MRRLLLAAPVWAALVLPASAHARPHLYALTCAFGDGRTHVLPRKLEAGSDDPLVCWADLANVSERLAPRLAGDLRAVAAGRSRSLKLGAFEPRLDRAQRAQSELVVAHDDWFPRVDWRGGGRPRLHLVLQVYDKRGSTRRARWQRVLVATLQVGHRRVRAGTPSFKANYLTWTPDPSRPRIDAPLAPRRPAHAGDYPGTSGRDDNP